MKIICSFVLAIALCSCGATSKKSSEMLADKYPAQCPFLTKDEKGEAVLSWVRMENDSTSAFCYAVSADSVRFGQPVVIPNSGNIQPHGENLPKIIFKPSGEIIALWGAANPNPANKYSGLVYYVQSFDKGKSWTAPRPLVNDTSSYDQRYYDVALLPNGEAAVIWLDNRKPANSEGSALYFATTNGKNGFTAERRISASCCQCCRTDLFVDASGGIHALYRSILMNSVRDMVHIVSLDGGKTFSTPKRISDDNWVLKGCPHTGPAMSENSKGLQFAWFTGGAHAGCYVTTSSDNGQSFAPRDSVSRLGSHPQMARLNKDELLVVWDEQVSESEPFRRIGIQRRGIGAGKVATQYLTSDTVMSTFPVVAAIDPEHAFVAYTTKREGKNFIAYQRQ